MLLIVLLVLFVVIMFLWFISMVGGANIPSVVASHSGWLAFSACLVLGLAVFLKL